MSTEQDEQEFRIALVETRTAHMRTFFPKFRHSGIRLLIITAAVALTLKGMPLHAWWSPFGVIGLLIWLYFFCGTLINAGMVLRIWLDGKGKQPTLEEAERLMKKNSSPH